MSKIIGLYFLQFPQYIPTRGLTGRRPPPSGRGAQYPDDEAAIAECIGLARGMTSKHAAYGTGFSGAKLVVNCDGERPAPAARPAAEG